MSTHFWKNEKLFRKEIFSIDSKSIKIRKMFHEAPDGVGTQVGEVVHEVDVKVDDGYDMPMSIYSQHNSSLLSKLLRSKFLFQVSFQISNRLKEFQE